MKQILYCLFLLLTLPCIATIILRVKEVNKLRKLHEEELKGLK